MNDVYDFFTVSSAYLVIAGEIVKRWAVNTASQFEILELGSRQSFSRNFLRERKFDKRKVKSNASLDLQKLFMSIDKIYLKCSVFEFKFFKWSTEAPS